MAQGKTHTLESIIANTKKVGECYEWQMARDKDGYGKVWFHGKGNQIVSRVVYTLVHGEIKPGNLIMHSCDNPPCCNPDHLSQGTHQDNHDDSRRKGRSRPMNGEDNPRGKLTEHQVRMAYYLNKTGISQRDLALLFNVSRRSISQIVHGRAWKHLNLVAAEGVLESGTTSSKISGYKSDAVSIKSAE